MRSVVFCRLLTATSWMGWQMSSVCRAEHWRRAGAVGITVLAAIALGPDAAANAAPAPGCPQGPSPGPGLGCGRRAFLADISSAGLGDNAGKQVALDQGLDMCGLMDAGLTRQEMVSQFAADNPGLGLDGAA